MQGLGTRAAERQFPVADKACYLHLLTIRRKFYSSIAPSVRSWF